MWVVKLGGSLADASELPVWLSALAARPELILVPGGGPFADQVRRAQGRWGFDDASAHHLALLAMEQYGRMLCALQPGLVPAATIAEIRSIARTGATPVWMPVAMALADPSIPTSWEMTSDSLAAWLSKQVDGEALVLIKAAERPLESATLATLVRDGIVDPFLPIYAEAARVAIHLFSVQDPSALERLDALITAPLPTEGPDSP